MDKIELLEHVLLYAADKGADAGLSSMVQRFKDRRKKAHRLIRVEIGRWASTLPDDAGIPANFMETAASENDGDEVPQPCRELLARLADGYIPEEALVVTALMARVEPMLRRSIDPTLAPFFRQEKAVVLRELTRLAKRIDEALRSDSEIREYDASLRIREVHQHTVRKLPETPGAGGSVSMTDSQEQQHPGVGSVVTRGNPIGQATSHSLAPVDGSPPTHPVVRVAYRQILAGKAGAAVETLRGLVDDTNADGDVGPYRPESDSEFWEVRGRAFLMLGNYDGARACLNKALALAPGKLELIRRYALTLFHLGKIDAGMAYLEPYYAGETPDQKIVAAVLQGHLMDRDLEAATALLNRYEDPDEPILRHAVAHGQIVVGDPAAALRVLRRTKRSQLTRVAWHALMGMAYSALAGLDGRVREEWNPVERSYAVRAVGHYGVALRLVDSSAVDHVCELLGLRGNVLFHIGEFERAERDYRRALEVSRQAGDIGVNLFLLLCMKGDYDAALATVAVVGDQDPATTLVKARAFAHVGREAEGLSTLRAMEVEPGSELDCARIESMLQILDGLGKHDECEAPLDELRSFDTPVARVTLGNYLLHAGRLDAAIDALSADPGGDDEYSRRGRDLLATAFARRGDLEEAREILEAESALGPRFNRWGDLAALRWNTGSRSEAISAAERAAGELDEWGNANRVLVAAAEYVSDWKSAAGLLEVLAERDDADASVVVRYALALLRSADGNRAVAAIRRRWDLVAQNGEPTELVRTAILLLAYEPELARLMAYRAWERSTDSAEAQFMYLMFGFSVGGRVKEESPRVVARGTMVDIEIQGATRRYSILNVDDMAVDHSYLAVGDALAAKLIGREVGDEVLLKATDFETIEGKIVRIETNEFRAVQDTLMRFTERFPDYDGLWRVEVDPERPEELLKLFDSRQDQLSELKGKYSRGEVPVHLLSNASGRTVPEVTIALSNMSDTRVRVSNLWPQEIEALTAIETDWPATVVFDGSALATAWLLRASGRVESLQGTRVAIASAVVDSLREARLKARPFGSVEGVTVVKEGGVYKTRPMEDVAGFMDEMLRRIDEMAEVLPAKGVIGMSPDVERMATTAFGRAGVHSAVLAADYNAVFVVDDVYAQRALGGLLGVRCVGTWQWLLLLRRTGRIGEDEYAEALGVLAAHRHSVMQVNADLIWRAAERAGTRLTAEVEGLLEQLAPPCTWQSAVAVAGAFCREVALDNARVFRGQGLVIAALGALERHANEWVPLDLLLGGFLRAATAGLRLAPRSDEWLREVVLAWRLQREVQH